MGGTDEMKTPNTMPDALIREFARGNVVLFIGAGLSQGAGLPGWIDLMKPLADRVGYRLPADRSLVTGDHLLRAAQYFLNTMGRRALAEYLRERLESTNIVLTESLRLLARLPATTIFTTNFDDLLERALKAGNRPFTRITTAIHFTQASSDKVRLVKMHGSWEQPETLVVTLSDYHQYFRTHALLAQQLSASLVDKTFLFVGYSLTDHNFNQIHAQIEYDLGHHGRRAYAAMFNPSPMDVDDLAVRNIHVISLRGETVEARNRALAEWLGELETKIEALPEYEKSPVLSARKTLRTLKRPYKFLDHFDTNDADIFFGRDLEIEEVFSKIVSTRLLIIYGKSGTGKSSLVNAGIIPNLPSNYLPLVIRCLDDPLETLRVGLRGLGVIGLEEKSSMRDLMKLVQQLTGKTLVIVLDQFEELFVRLNEESRGGVIRELSACHRDPAIDLRLVFVIREDFLAEMSKFRPELPEIFHNEYRLLPLSRAQAREAICRPVEQLGMAYEPSLVEQLLTDLDQDGVEPPHLQIVCDRLYDEVVRKGELNVTRAIYESLGRTAAILQGYLDRVLRELSAGERDLAWRVLKAMITSYDTRQVSSAGEMAEVLAEESTEVEEVLANLSRARIVRPFGSERIMFELAHECLIPRIKEFLSLEEIERKRASELLRREKETYEQFGRLAPRDIFGIVNQHRDSLAFDRSTLRFLILSAIRHGVEPGYWLKRMPRDDPDLVQRLVSDLEGPGPALQRNTAIALILLGAGGSLFDRILNKLERVGNPSVVQHLRDSSLPAETIGKVEKAIIVRIMRNMVYVPLGEFLMGSTREDVDRVLKEWDVPRRWIETEMPQHRVHTEGFCMDKYLVTNAEYQEYEEGHDFPLDRADHPAVSISWSMARAYAAWLGKRLPTEAEWEKSARGTEGRTYPWGDMFSVDKCNSYEAGIRTTTPVTQYDREGCRSPYGCCDMAGNVWEWTSSLDKPYPYDPLDGRENPMLEGSRIVRGGSFAFYRYVVSTTYRFGAGPIAIDTNQGFRCCISEVPRSLPVQGGDCDRQ